MHIARFAGIHIRVSDQPNLLDETLGFENTDVYLKAVGQEHGGQNYRAIAVRKFRPEATSLLDLAHGERKMCESSIQHIANLLGIASCCEHLVVSELPVIAFRPDSTIEEEFVAPLLDEFGYVGSSRMEMGRLLFKHMGNYIDLSRDRPNGTSALAAALNCSTKLAQYRELVRFFEIAFRMPFVQMDKKLHQFLKVTNLKFDREEIRKWKSFRHTTIHGDGANNREMSFEIDVAPYLERMKMAALDVLFNKARWSCRDTGRRKGYEIPGFSRDGDELIASDNYIEARVVMMDQFGVWAVKSASVDVQKLKSDGWRFTSSNCTPT